ncbi:MAG: hypothetical protein ACXAEU_25595, partial [Candidatus Hodarchaeales archaeon]
KKEKERTDVEKRLFRAMEWFYRAKRSADIPDKINSYFFALEALLTSKDDRSKGEALVIRSNLLSSRLDDYHRLPDNFLWLYKLRSDLVHGSENPSVMEISSKMSFFDEKDLERQFSYPLEFEVRRIIIDYVRLFKKINPKKLKNIIDWLEVRDEKFELLYSWMTEHYRHPELLKFWDANYS